MAILARNVWNLEKYGLVAPGRRLLDLGSSNLYDATPQEVVDFVRRHNPSPRPDLENWAATFAAGCPHNEAFVGEMFEAAGIGYDAVDIADGYGTTILDLNTEPLPGDMVGAYDSVVNFGTSEHIINQMNVFASVHAATKIGGMMMHSVPAVGYIDHGYFIYTARFFFDLSSRHGYEIVDIWFEESPAGPENLFDSLRAFKPYFQACAERIELPTERDQALDKLTIPMIALVVVLRKVRDMPFVGTIETSTSVGIVPARVLGGYVQPTSPKGAASPEQLDQMTTQLQEEVAGFRAGLIDDPKQVDELLSLYHRFVDKGLTFPLDLEEHSLRLILKFLRPDDSGAADRLRDVIALRYKETAGDLPSDPLVAEVANAADRVEALEQEAERLRRAPGDSVDLIEAIQALYSGYQAAGRPFPFDLEEKSLRLILMLLRPYDDSVLRRLTEVLRLQGKSVGEGMGVQQKFVLEEIAASKLGPAEEGLPPTPSQRLVFVMGLPKSASRLTTEILAAAHPDDRYRKTATPPYTTGYAGLDATAELRYDALVGGDVGGVVHSHAAATTNTRQTLAYLGLRHVIVVRHPADHLAALYCHQRRIMVTAPSSFRESLTTSKRNLSRLSDPQSYYDRYTDSDQPNDLYWHYVIFPLDPHYFVDADDIDAAVTHMIVGGYLFHALSWIASWQLLRVRNISTIVRFEDLIGNPQITVRHLLSSVFPNHDDDAVARGLDAIRSADAVQPNASIYPRGYTGDVGVWKQYFSSKNRDLYNSVCDNFVKTHPYGRLLTVLYGDLKI